jgi:hypothetical protein
MDDIRSSLHRSPPLGAVAVVFVLLFAASIAVTLASSGGAPYPTPYRAVAEAQQFYARFAGPLRVSALLQLGAMVPLAVYSAAVFSRLLFHRVEVAGPYIAGFGGAAAAIFLGISALAAWTLTQPGIAEDAAVLRLAQLLAFASGGFAHTLALGLLLAGVSVPALAFGLLRRWLCWVGLGIAALCMCSLLALLLPELSVLLPLARFPAYLWLIGAGFSLPRARASTSRGSASA